MTPARKPPPEDVEKARKLMPERGAFIVSKDTVQRFIDAGLIVRRKVVRHGR